MKTLEEYEELDLRAAVATVRKAINAARRAHVKAARERLKKDQTLFAKLEKRFGAGVFVRFAGPVERVECFPTGFSHLDDLLTGETDEHGATVVGTGRGMPIGKIIELGGKEGSGKTSLALHLVVAAQRFGVRVAFVDAEHAVDLPYATRIGVSLDRRHLIFNQPSTAEEGLSLLDHLIKQRAVGIVVVDSVAALVPEVEVRGEMGEGAIALQARLMSQALRKVKALAHENEVTVLFINQLRQKIGGFSRFGPPPEQTTGGNALRYYADIRLDMRVIRQIKKGVKAVGAMSRIKSIKNKVAPPFRDAYVEMRFGKGVQNVWPSDDVDAAGDSE